MPNEMELNSGSHVGKFQSPESMSVYDWYGDRHCCYCQQKMNVGEGDGDEKKRGIQNLDAPWGTGLFGLVLS